MIISKVEVLEIELSGQGGIALWHPVFARVTTDEGISGLGEVGMAYGTGAQAAGPMILALAERLLLGSDPFATETLWERMLRRSFWAEGGGPVIFGAMSALDAALWDIKGRALEQPVHRLLGAETPAPLRCYASQLQFDWLSDRVINLSDPTQYREAAQRAQAEGFDCVKVDPLMIGLDGQRETKLRGSLDPQARRKARARMEAVRDGLGGDIDIILELHSFTSMQGALQVADLVKDLGVIFVEEPTHYNCANAHNQVAQKSHIPMAGGERLYTRWGFMPYFEAGSLALAQPDVGLAGGISEAFKISHMAHAYDIGIQAHVCGSPLATAIALQLEAAIPNLEFHEHHTYALKSCNRDLFVEDLQPVHGRFPVPTAPGFGMTLSPKAEAQMSVMSVSL